MINDLTCTMYHVYQSFRHQTTRASIDQVIAAYSTNLDITEGQFVAVALQGKRKAICSLFMAEVRVIQLMHCDLSSLFTISKHMLNATSYYWYVVILEYLFSFNEYIVPDFIMLTMFQVDTVEDDGVSLRYMVKDGNMYSWPPDDDYSFELITAVVCVMETPTLVNSRGQFRFSKENIDEAQAKALDKTNIKTVTLK